MREEEIEAGNKRKKIGGIQYHLDEVFVTAPFHAIASDKLNYLVSPCNDCAVFSYYSP